MQVIGISIAEIDEKTNILMQNKSSCAACFLTVYFFFLILRTLFKTRGRSS